ncbi:hypothetical protein GH714_022213 [Hevea brasiliensis]|uniref:Amidase domain-containing protein n=1 Tax=Hevea brasiliensis TaxID=3981 RepID=A0A6A6LE09_HEVBR|nr:hypothetical protein GH714_022213 [Hevea brasiliensis]
MERSSDYGAFMEKFVLKPSSSSHEFPLNGLTFAVKDIFDVNGFVTGFGNPDWARTHSAATSTAPAVLAILRGGATCVGKTVMDEMAYSLDGDNKHYGTPTNPCAPDRVPGGSSSGSAVAVGAKLVDFSLGTDTGGSVRVPASYCSILGFRPSHDAVSTAGVIPMAQVLILWVRNQHCHGFILNEFIGPNKPTGGWFARDPVILNRVGRILLQLPDVDLVRPRQIFIAEDCFQLSSIPNNRVSQVLVKSVEKLFGGDVVKHLILGDYVENKVPSLSHFISKEIKKQDYGIASLAALSSAMRLLQRYKRMYLLDLIGFIFYLKRRYEFKKTMDFGILAIPTVPGRPPKLNTDPTTLEIFRAEASSLLSIAGLSGFCQVSIPLGMYNDVPVAISLLAKHGSDGFLLNVVETLYDTLQEQIAISE